VHLLIAATSSTQPLVEPNAGLLVASLAVSGLTLLLFGLLAFQTRVRTPDEAPATMDPPAVDERPALVGFLARDFEVPTEAVAATLIDLAARGWLAIEPAGGDQIVVRVPSRDGKGTLVPYERRVLDHVRDIAVGGVVPAGALTTGSEDVSARWWAGFSREVIGEARGRGLCQNRWPAGVKLLFVLGGLAAAAALYGAGKGHDLDEVHTTALWWTALGGVALLVLTAGAIAKSTRQRDTEAGRADAARWLGLRRFLADHGDFQQAPATSVAIWDAYLGWAATFGLAPVAVESLPLGTEDDRRAWSSFGGTWRRVRIRYPRWRAGWGRHPAMAIAAGLLWVGLAGAAIYGLGALASSDRLDTYRFDRWIDLGAAVVAVVVGVIAAYSFVAVVCGVADLFRTVEVDGVVLRRRTRARSSPRAPRLVRWLADREAPDDPPRVRWFLAVDDGEGLVVDAWSVPVRTYDRVRQGALVHATVTPLLRHVRAIETTAASSPVPVDAAPAAARSGQTDPALVDAAARVSARRFSPR
jgi:hypothetical protein